MAFAAFLFSRNLNANNFPCCCCCYQRGKVFNFQLFPHYFPDFPLINLVLINIVRRQRRRRCHQCCQCEKKSSIIIAVVFTTQVLLPFSKEKNRQFCSKAQKLLFSYSITLEPFAALWVLVVWWFFVAITQNQLNSFSSFFLANSQNAVFPRF